MMEMEVPHPSQQDMDLIDILWKQDIDLGARREVFDYNHRQKECELQRQRELDEQKRQHLLQEQEKALLAQLQLDEETGEYIPRPAPSIPLQAAGTPLEVTQNLTFIEENNDAISFDECLQLLAETFPVEETGVNTSSFFNETFVDIACSLMVYLQNTSMSLCTADSSPSTTVMTPEQPSLLPTTPSPVQLPPHRMSTDLEQAWMELLSLPELQQCMHMQMEDTLETTIYPNSEVQNPNYTYYPVSENASNACAAGYLSSFNAVTPNVLPSDNQSQVDAPANYTAEAEDFCDLFYPKNVTAESSGRDEYDSNIMSGVPNNSPFTPIDLYSLSPGEAFDRDKPGLTVEMPDSDSGISNASPNTSSNASSPSKSVYDGFGYSDSDMDETDHNPGSAQSDYSEMFSLNFTPDDLPGTSVSISTDQSTTQNEKNPKKQRTKLAEESGHNRGPFTKDKLKKRSDVRLTRDEQRAKALKIPFTVDMIINLPVDDFNELMSKHQLNEAQLALVRDIRRRGKNKVAAQNCRKRKMENIVGLESDLDSLQDEKERLLSEKSKNLMNLKEMKKQLSSLYLEVFSLLKDEKGNGYSPSEYSLQQSTDGSVFLVPRIKKTFVKREDNHLSLK
ncbi:nuclear factor erythroid 2-related factor 2a isoform X1 [Periophthalmus magnuspinnatus]|uniref:nuclear factor erythroid 2-related factor 2a isoform X1 n=1 Tax=Periophthalmus magnuspinnatus TaxID=409849 RepID=UPI00145B9E57|nr:nuclear factor erythroid 2-related factor 2a isoform X1 [Periophthalmus magnuspinnatus]